MSSRLTVDLNAIRENVREIRRLIGPDVSLAAVIKADAYGLGAAGVAPAMIEGGADVLAVARYGEAEELLRIHPKLSRPLMVMGLCSDEELLRAAGGRIIITIDSYRQARILSDTGKETVVHIKIDTGFSRLGLKASDPLALDEYGKICSLPGIRTGGIFSHLALDGKESDARQFELFTRFIGEAESRHWPVGKKHICDSIGMARYPEYRLDMVRTGAILYGMRPFRSPLIENLPLQFSLRWTVPVIKISELAEGEGVSYDYSWKAPEGGARVATLPVGYADGYKRTLSNRGEVLLKGTRCPVVGVICMDQMMIDVSAVTDAVVGDEVLLLGGEISILEMAEKAGSNRNDILASIGRRVKRVYTDGGKEVGELDYLLSPSYRSRIDG